MVHEDFHKELESVRTKLSQNVTTIEELISVSKDLAKIADRLDSQKEESVKKELTQKINKMTQAINELITETNNLVGIYENLHGYLKEAHAKVEGSVLSPITK